MKVRKISIFTRLFLWLALLLLLGNGILGVLTYNSSKTSLFGQIQSNAMNIAQCAAANISADVFKEIEAGEEGTEAYHIIVDELALFRDNAEIEYIYTLRKTDQDKFVFVVDSDTEEPADIGEQCERTEALAAAFHEQVTKADDKPTTDEWGMHLSAYSPIVHDGITVGVVGVDISTKWIDKQTMNLLKLVAVTCLFTYIVCLLLLHFLIFGLRKSMKKLNDKVRELASGSGDLTKEIDLTTGDELELIAGNMNIFIRQIRSLVKDVAWSSKDIIGAGQELDSTVRDNINLMTAMKKEIKSISTNMERSSDSSQLLYQNLSENAEHIAAFAGSINEIRDMVQQANEHAQYTANAAKENRKYALSSIASLQQKIENIDKDMQKIELVKKIAEGIRSIAAQTRMLSLNAQIEASRAGTAGAGFAVVATEVGKLSNDIDQAVAEINMINSQVLEAVGTMNEVSGEMIRFVSDEVVRDYDAFAGLGEEYGSTTDFICQQMVGIENQSMQIAKDISNINTNIQTITETVAATAESADDLVKSTVKISDSLEKLNAASQKNTSHSEKLNGHIGKYHFQ